MIEIRQARGADAASMCALLNEIIEIGGTTAHQTQMDPDHILGHYIQGSRSISCAVAVENDFVLGFQSLQWTDPDYDGPHPLPKGWAVIATFVRTGSAGKGIGRQLFRETLARATSANVPTIDATIRADNSSGLRYYGAIGFDDYARLINIPLSDGTRVDRIRKRFDLD